MGRPTPSTLSRLNSSPAGALLGLGGVCIALVLLVLLWLFWEGFRTRPRTESGNQLETPLVTEPVDPTDAPPVLTSRREGLTDRRQVGEGKFAVVFSAFCPRAGKRIAYKEAKESGEQAAEKFRQEYERLLLFLGIERLVQAIEFDDGLRDGGHVPPHLYMELLDEGSDLQKTRQEWRETTYSPATKEVLTIATSLAQGMELLHSEGMLHRDLKPENVFVHRDFQVKLLDLGDAVVKTNDNQLTDLREAKGTTGFMAPEVCKLRLGQTLEESYDEKVDVYSYAIILYELLMGRNAWADLREVGIIITNYAHASREGVGMRAIAEAVAEGRTPWVDEGPPKHGEVLHGLMQRCWSTDPDNRPLFPEIVEVLKAELSAMEG